MNSSSPAAGWPLSALGLPARSEPLVLVLGLARSGLAAARMLLARGAAIRLLGLERPEGAEGERLTELVARGASLRLGPHDPADLDGVDLIVKSPGVRPEIPFLEAAREAGVPIVGELEIAFLAAEGPVYAITGTNGKSTTTAWVGHMLAAAGREVEVAGNIGHAFADAVMRSPGAEFVVEVSSFQLEDTLTFHPRVATLLNLSPDHLDRHGTLEAYAAAKSRIFRNQTEADIAVFGGDANLDAMANQVPARVLRTGKDQGELIGAPAAEPQGAPAGGKTGTSAQEAREGVFVREGDLVLRFSTPPRDGVVRLLPVSELALPGAHNVENAMAAAATAASAGVPVDAIVRSLRTFPGLAHRLEPVGVVGGVACVNDSKATNVGSLEVALAAFPEPVRLIAGGVGKGQDFRPLAEDVRARTRSVHLIGESADVLAEAWAGADLHRAGSLAEALDQALSLSRPGDRILLSPGCASFDMFRDFEDRGDQFRALVNARAGARGGAQ
ncbi:MAG: UDP-N-acetylmuramoyl-L-alanine--D-glutamate ligase [Candidatus Eisenbacteria bacterium]